MSLKWESWSNVMNQAVILFFITLGVVLPHAHGEVVDSSNKTQQNQSSEVKSPALAASESRLAERFDRLELLAGRLSELSRSTQPRRARLLRDLIAKSRQQNVAGRFDAVIDALNQEDYAKALASQQQLGSDLELLLGLLLEEDRDQQIESQRKRIGRYLAELKKLIRQQQGIRARTEGGDEPNHLSDDQQRVAKATEKLRTNIAKTEQVESPSSGAEQDPTVPTKPPNQTPPDKSNKEGQGTPQKNQSQKPEKGSPSPNKNASGKDASPSESSSENPQTPSEKAVDRLKKAQQQMQQAIKQLKEAKQQATEAAQEQALRQLEQAKAELERILRQLREEERERLLVLLEARFRRMLDAQIEVYEGTKKLEAAKEKTAPHETEIAGGRLSRQERQIIRDADRAMVLLREDGTSVAFPEAIDQARSDMATIANRLNATKLGVITQGLEEDVIAALEETLDSLQQAIEKLREQRGGPTQSGGQPGEQPLVDELAELRMIKSLQKRINRSTKRYDQLLGGHRADDAELLEALDQLAVRQQRVFEATRELDSGKNR